MKEVLRFPPWDCVRRSWDAFLQRFWLLFLGHLLASIIMQGVPFLFGPFWYGLSYACLLAVRGESPVVQDLFSGFSRFLKTFLLGLFIFLICTIPILVLGMPALTLFMHAVYVGDQVSGTLYLVVFAFFMLLPTLLAVIFYSPAFFILADQPQCSAWQAMEASRRMVWRNLSAWRNLYAAVVILHLLGMAACCVGFFVVMPLTVVVQALAYEMQRQAEQRENIEAPGTL